MWRDGQSNTSRFKRILNPANSAKAACLACGLIDILGHMTAQRPGPRRRIGAREVRWSIYLLILLGVAFWRYVPRPWRPAVTVETPHYAIDATTDRFRAEELGRVMELLYTAYSNRFNGLPGFKGQHNRLKVRLYRDRKEFRWVNPSVGWAEAFYRPCCCHAYFAADEINPYHWMLHEAVHQLNREVAHLDLAKWLEEGLADYFSTSRIGQNGLALGRIDPNTYPVWWIDELATAPDLDTNLANGSVIPLRAIISNRGGPSINKEFNLYYLHWWTLTHFLFEAEEYQASTMILLEQGGGPEAFEKLIGHAETVQLNWHRYVRRMKAALSGQDVDFLRKLE
jgi:hypothetical protein